MSDTLLFKRVAEMAGCSNGEARRLVRAGNIAVNGEPSNDEMMVVSPSDAVEISASQKSVLQGDEMLSSSDGISPPSRFQASVLRSVCLYFSPQREAVCLDHPSLLEGGASL
ncbi:hypothetical protein GVI59_17810 [Acetobacter sicerae]|nr:hypothetical protein [Acetobacter sicerae]